jgi:hypothetical protein
MRSDLTRRHRSAAFADGNLCSYCRHFGSADYFPMHKYASMDTSNSFFVDISMGCTCHQQHSEDPTELKLVTRPVLDFDALKDIALAGSATALGVILVVAISYWS